MYLYTERNDLTINILYFQDVPSPPMGPLVVTDVTHNSAELEWKPPESDGGTPLTGYLIEYRNITRSTWSKARTVDANTTKFSLKDLLEDTEYYFRVFAINDEGHSQPLMTDDVTKPTKDLRKLILTFEDSS